jgi:hypothetical protein
LSRPYGLGVEDEIVHARSCDSLLLFANTMITVQRFDLSNDRFGKIDSCRAAPASVRFPPKNACPVAPPVKADPTQRRRRLTATAAPPKARIVQQENQVIFE